MKSDRRNDYISHMAEAARNAVSFTEGLEIEDFLDDKKHNRQLS